MKAKELRTEYAAKTTGEMPYLTNYAKWLENRLEQQPIVSNKCQCSEDKGWTTVMACNMCGFVCDPVWQEKNHPHLGPPGFEHLSNDVQESGVTTDHTVIPQPISDSIPWSEVDTFIEAFHKTYRNKPWTTYSFRKALKNWLKSKDEIKKAQPISEPLKESTIELSKPEINDLLDADVLLIGGIKWYRGKIVTEALVEYAKKKIIEQPISEERIEDLGDDPDGDSDWRDG